MGEIIVVTSATKIQVQVVQSDGTTETLVDPEVVRYTTRIGKINDFTIILPAASTNDYSKFNTYQVTAGIESGVVYIYRFATQNIGAPNQLFEFNGVIQKIYYDSQRRLVLEGFGQEVKALWKATGVTKTYASQNLATTFTDLVGLVTGLSVGTNDAFSGDPLGALDVSNMQVWEALRHIVQENANHDLSTFYNNTASTQIRNSSFLGSSTPVGVLVDGIDIRNIVRVKDLNSIVNKITVQGKNEGVNQISVTLQADNALVDPTYDMTKYGTREPPTPYIDRRITNTTTATDIAVSILNQLKDPVEKITLEVVDLGLTHSLGDVFTIRTKQQITDGTSDNFTRNIRIIEITRTYQSNQESLSWQVTTSTKRTRAEDLVDYILNQQNKAIAHAGVPQFDQALTVSSLGIGAVSPAADTFIVASLKTISMNNRVQNVTDPVAAQDAATKNYVDTSVSASAFWESGGAGLIRPSSANISLIPKTSGNLGQAASPTWNIAYLSNLIIDATAANVAISSVSGGNIDIDLFSASNKTLTLKNTGAGVANFSMDGTSFSATAALGLFAQLNVNGSSSETLFVAGTARVSGNVNLDGNITLGDSTGDTISFTGRVNTNIVPSSNNTRNLGDGTTPLVFATIFSTAHVLSSTSLGFTPSQLLYVNGTSAFANTVTPTVDNSITLGNSSFRWSDFRTVLMTCSSSATFSGGTFTYNGTALNATGATATFSVVNIGASGTKTLFVSGDINLTGNLFKSGTQGIVTADIQNDQVTTPKLGTDLVAFRHTSDQTIGANTTSTFPITYGTAFSSTPTTSVGLEVVNSTPTGATIRNIHWVLNNCSTTAASIIVDNNNASSIQVRLTWHSHLAFN